MDQLSKITLRGFKSIREVKNFSFKPLNILIGSNGAGKSNFISFFKMLSWMTSAPNFQEIIGRWGGANSLLFYGAASTPQIEACLTFASPQGTNEYYIRLAHAANDTFIFAEEKYRFSRKSHSGEAPWTSLDAGHREAKLISAAQMQTDRTARFILNILKRCVVYQFHNTTDTARIRQRWAKDENIFLREDGCNLAPMLYRYQNEYPKYYTRIIETIRLIAPFFGDFYLEPENGSIMLRWTEAGSDMIFGPSQASDGTLRMLALVTLLMQPEELLPNVIILDEPELGLHPFAINVISGLIKSISSKSQVILATQSPYLLDFFEPDDVIIVERAKAGRTRQESAFNRLDPENLKDWLKEYTPSELWEKNVIGGNP
jgi:predicted ATPase